MGRLGSGAALGRFVDRTCARTAENSNVNVNKRRKATAFPAIASLPLVHEAGRAWVRKGDTSLPLREKFKPVHMRRECYQERAFSEQNDLQRGIRSAMLRELPAPAH